MSEQRTARDTAIRSAPRWLQGRIGSSLLYAMAAPLDAILDNLIAAVKSSSGAVRRSPDVLEAMGRDRGIRRGPNETADEYTARLANWRSARQLAGTPMELIRQVRGVLGASPPAVGVMSDAGSLILMAENGAIAVSNHGWSWDAVGGTGAKWARFWVVIYPNGRWDMAPTCGQAGRFVGDSPGASIGTTLPAPTVALVRRTVADWGAAHAVSVGIVCSYPGADLLANLPTGDWDTFRGRSTSFTIWDG